MPKVIELHKVSDKKILFTLKVDDVKVKSYDFLGTSNKSQAAVAKDAGVDVPTLLAWIDATGKDPKQFIIDTPKTGFPIYYRPVKEPRGAPVTFDTPIAFLNSLSGDRETIVEWDDQEQLGSLDIDYHGIANPGREWVETTIVTKLLPKPYLWHHSPRGFHAFYPAVGKLTGAEVAALAGMRWRTLDPSSGVEIKRQMRCPGAETLHKFEGYKELTSYVTDFLGVGESSVDPTGYLESLGLEIGSRYDHDKCPIDPTVAIDNRQPVTVSEAGIYCHRCAGLGRQLGRNRAGWMPFSVLCGNPGAGVLGTLVRRKCHWGHAKHVMDAYLGMTGEVAKQAYSAAIKLYHDGDIDGIFNPVTDNFVRMDGRWETVKEGHTFGKDITPIISVLPSAKDPATVCYLSQPVVDLTDFGYPAIQVLRGAKVSTRLLGTSRLVVAQPPKWLQEFGSVFYPRYVDSTVRMPIEEAWATLEEVLPKIDRKYVELLIIARGCHEAQVGLPQHILVSGPSKTGKTSHIQLAAGILGDDVTPVPATTDLEKFRSAIRDASQRGSYVSLDEFVKDTLRLNPRMTAEQVFEPLLNFDPNGLSHKMYLGPTVLGRIGVCVWTDTDFPAVLHDYTQVARRVHEYKLHQKLDWDSSMTAYGISEVKLIRTISQRHADACNAILSHISDEHFTSLLTFHQLCEKIGVCTLENSDDYEDMNAKRLELFTEVCKAPPLSDPSDAKKWPGKGYKLITRGGTEPLDEIWKIFSDTGKNWHEAKRLREKPFNEVLGVDDIVEIDTAHNGNRMAIRFRVGKLKSPTKINEEITQ